MHLSQNKDVNLLHAEDEFLSIQKSVTESIGADAARSLEVAARVETLGGTVEDRHRIARFRKGLQHLPEWKPPADNQNQNSVGPGRVPAHYIQASCGVSYCIRFWPAIRCRDSRH